MAAAPPSALNLVRELWRSWWHGLRRLPRRPARAATLGMHDLPDDAGRLPLGTPALLLMQDEASALQWTLQIISELLACGPVLLLATRAADADALWQHAALHQAYGDGRLRVALMPAPALTRLRRDGLMRWADELDRAGLATGASLCLLDARALLAGASTAELRRLGTQLRHLAARHPWPAVLLLPLARMADGGAFLDGARIAAAARSTTLGMSHVATLAQGPHGAALTLHAWDGAHGAIFHTRHDLRRDGEAWVYAGNTTQGEIPLLVEAPDIDVVYATSACLANGVQAPAHWIVRATMTELELAAKEAVGATLLLDAGEPEQFEALGALVYHLRQTRPASLKIIVRETTSKLRAHSEQALLALGATTVAYRELGFSRLLRLIETQRQTVHQPPLARDLETTLAAFRPAPVRGYLAPAAFEREVRAVFERQEASELTHTLVYLQLLPRVAHLDALRACRALRDGDLVSTDTSGLWVFLFACGAPDVPRTLGHMFTLALDQLFTAQAVDCSAAGIAVSLRRLRAQASELPDYSAELPATTPRTTPPVTATPASAPAAPGLLPLVQAVPVLTKGEPDAPRVHASPIARRATIKPRVSP